MKCTIAVGMISVFMVAAGSARAQFTVIPIENPSFELPDLPSAGTYSFPQGWGWAGAGDIYYPSQHQFSGTNAFGPADKPAVGIPDGRQVAVTTGRGQIFQTVAGLKISAGVQYCLTVDVGQPLDNPALPFDYAIRLQSGQDTSIGKTASQPQPQRGFFTTKQDSPIASFIGNLKTQGNDLQILLTSQNTANFDNVRLIGSGQLIIDAFNQFVPNPTVPCGSFQIVAKGDVRNNIDVASTAKDILINPFAYSDMHYGQALGTASVTTSLDKDGNTVITFSGPRAIQPTDRSQFQNGLPHFGVNGFASSTDGTVLHTLSQTWLSGTPQGSLPGLSFLGPTLTDQVTDFATVYADVTANGQTVGQWFEVPRTALGRQLSLINETQMCETLSNVGWLESNTAIPLNQLNWPNMPPTGQAGSPFIPLHELDGITLCSGAAVSLSTPEPGSISLLAGLGITGSLCAVRRRRRMTGNV